MMTLYKRSALFLFLVMATSCKGQVPIHKELAKSFSVDNNVVFWYDDNRIKIKTKEFGLYIANRRKAAASPSPAVPALTFGESVPANITGELVVGEELYEMQISRDEEEGTMSIRVKSYGKGDEVTQTFAYNKSLCTAIAWQRRSETTNRTMSVGIESVTHKWENATFHVQGDTITNSSWTERNDNRQPPTFESGTYTYDANEAWKVIEPAYCFLYVAEKVLGSPQIKCGKTQAYVLGDTDSLHRFYERHVQPYFEKHLPGLQPGVNFKVAIRSSGKAQLVDSTFVLYLKPRYTDEQHAYAAKHAAPLKELIKAHLNELRFVPRSRLCKKKHSILYVAFFGYDHATGHAYYNYDAMQELNDKENELRYKE